MKETSNKSIKIFAIIRKICIWLVIIVAYSFVGYVLASDPLQNIYSFYQVKLNLAISSPDPVEKVSALEEVKDSEIITETKNYIFTSPSGEQEKKIVNKKIDVNSPIVVFQGRVTYPNSTVLLEFSSQKFYISTRSDLYGRWSWANYGHPFPSGDHLITVYNFTPLKNQEKEEIFVQQYTFAVTNEEPANPPPLLTMDCETWDCTTKEVYLIDRLKQGGVANFSLFEASTIGNQVEYNPGDEIGVQLSFTPLTINKQAEASLQYELYALRNNGAEAELVSSFEDKLNLNLDKQQSFIKKFKLAYLVSGGNYVLITTAYIDSDTYLQSSPFLIKQYPFIPVASAEKSKGKNIIDATFWNMAVLLIIIIIILIVVAAEYRRLLISHMVDEEILNKAGYFKKINNK